MTSSSVLVLILQGESKAGDSNVSNLQWIFSDPYFAVRTLSVAPPDIAPSSKTLSSAQYIENYVMRKALEYAAQDQWSNLPVLIVKDSSVSNVVNMKQIIHTVLTQAARADLYYLTTWNDACNKYTDVEGISGAIEYGSTLQWTTRPNATQAILYSSSARDFTIKTLKTSDMVVGDMLNYNIQKGKLTAVAFVPNLIDFDVTLATANTDYNKLSQCAAVDSTNTTQTTWATVLWFIFVVILMFLVGWSLITLGPK
jgi:hypothetical protein